MSDKAVTVRLPESVLTHLMGLCVLDDGTLAEQLRRATTEYVDRRRASPSFRDEVAKARKRQTAALDALEPDATPEPVSG